MASERDTWQQHTGRKCPVCHATLSAGGTCPACDPGTLPTAAASAGSNSSGPASGSPSDAPASASPGSSSAASEPELDAGSTRSGLPPMRLGRGTRVSVYRIESVLGEGGMGVVYRAWDEAVGRFVALKCLHTNLAGDPDIRRRFAREARVLRSYTHPNVIQVYDFVEFDYLLGIVMELVDGPSLVQYLSKWRGRMPLGEVRELFSGVLQAIGEGHNQGIVHRDLKPDNILVSGEGGARHPKVVDFGIAKILEGTTYTMSGAFLGTCCYMSPEQVQHPAAADHRSDIYSLGVTLYQLCTGRVPFEGNHFSVMMAHVQQAPRPPRELRPDLPEQLERLILDALAKDPAQRPATCEHFQQRLEEALQAIPRGPSRAQAAALPSVVKGEAGVEMILVPAGSFQMGRERRSVYLDAFYMDATPVTNKDYITFVEITGYRPTDEGSGRFLSHLHARKIPKGKELHPVVFVSYRDASAYAAWAGKRLPTEAEWEKAARGTDARKYPWGRLEPSALTANYGKMHGDTIPVGSLPDGASPYGIQDLAGNVWEWCSDYDDPSFYSDGPPSNPRNTRGGPKSRLVMRGGSYMYGPGSLRTYSRTSFEAHYRFGDGGFRCVRSVE